MRKVKVIQLAAKLVVERIMMTNCRLTQGEGEERFFECIHTSR